MFILTFKKGPHVLLGAVVRGRDTQGIGEAGNLITVGVQPVKQVHVFGPSLIPAPARTMVGVGRPPGFDVFVLAVPVLDQQGLCEGISPIIRGPVGDPDELQ